MPKTNHERYAFAEQLYCFTDKSIPEIAAITCIPERTLFQRARDYKWDTLRRASRRSPMILCEEMYRELADLNAEIQSRPEGKRKPTYSEAELRRKILYSIAAVKKFPTHAEVLFIMQSLIRYGNHFHFDRVDGLENLIDAFLSHRDIYGFASYQPEHNQDINYPTEQELEDLDQYRSPEDTTADLNQDTLQTPMSNRAALSRTPEGQPDIITKFKTTPSPLSSSAKSKGATGNTFTS